MGRNMKMNGRLMCKRYRKQARNGCAVWYFEDGGKIPDITNGR